MTTESTAGPVEIVAMEVNLVPGRTESEREALRELREQQREERERQYGPEPEEPLDPIACPSPPPQQQHDEN